MNLWRSALRGGVFFPLVVSTAAALSLFVGRCAARDLQVEAIAGRPFGVATITLPPQAESAGTLTGQIFLVERDGRALYPAVSVGRVRRLLGELLGADLNNGPSALSVSFLFTGDEPLRLTLYTPQPVKLDVVPRSDARRLDRALSQWWRDYNAVARQQLSDGDYPPIVQTYLTSMLARRLRLEPPLLSQLGDENPNEFQRDLELLLGLERLRLATLKQTMQGGGDNVPASLPPPPEIAWGPRAQPPFDPGVAIEPIALRVPEECFYIRFGKFSNYVWLSNLMDDYGGDIGSMVTLRGLKSAGDERVQRQLALKQSAIGDLLGDTVISDVAIIGRDLYLQEGAALGLLFQARNALLGSSLQSDRQTALKEELKNGATLETVKIANRDVSFLSTPDNRVRSFYVVDGDFHLVTNSRAIVERFLSMGEASAESLGASTEFKHARTQMPASRDDTVFVYFSPGFFRGLASPQYQIELARRLNSLTDAQLIQLAQLAARAERRPGETIDELIAAELLPNGFGRRPDGSGPIVTSKEIVDSLRGALGTFTPIADIRIKAVTPREAERCAARAAYLESQWKQMDPLIVAVRRYALDAKDPRVAAGDRLERIVIQGTVSPLDEGKYGKYLSMLGPPTRERVTPAANDIISVQAQLKGGLIFPSVPPHHIFLGVQDALPVTDLKPNGLLKTLKILQTTPGYLGAWPKPGFLDMLPLGLGGGRPDPAGYSQLLLGLWRRQWGEFSALSFDRQVLDFVTPQLRIEPTDSDAQIRVHVGDLARSRIAPWITALNHQRALQASLGNARLLNYLSQQLHVVRPDARRVAEQLLDAKLVCTLGGEYEYRGDDPWTGTWLSTAWPTDERMPEKYQAPILGWFRGLDSSLIKWDDKMLVHAELDMQRKANEPKVELPFFNLFGGGEKKPTPAPKPASPDDRTTNPPEKKPEPLPPPKPALLPVPAPVK